MESPAPTRLSSGLFRRPEGLLTQRNIKEARKTGWNQRAPASSPPLPFGNRLSGPLRRTPPSPPRPLLYRADLHDDRTGLTPDQNPARQPRGARCYQSQLKSRPADAQRRAEASAWRGLNLLIPQQHLQGDPRPTQEDALLLQTYRHVHARTVCCLSTAAFPGAFLADRRQGSGWKRGFTSQDPGSGFKIRVVQMNQELITFACRRLLLWLRPSQACQQAAELQLVSIAAHLKGPGALYFEIRSPVRPPTWRRLCGSDDSQKHD